MTSATPVDVPTAPRNATPTLVRVLFGDASEAGKRRELQDQRPQDLTVDIRSGLQGLITGRRSEKLLPSRVLTSASRPSASKADEHKYRTDSNAVVGGKAAGSAAGCAVDGTCIYLQTELRVDMLDCSRRQLVTLPCLHRRHLKSRHGSGMIGDSGGSKSIVDTVRILRLSRNRITRLTNSVAVANGEGEIEAEEAKDEVAEGGKGGEVEKLNLNGNGAETEPVSDSICGQVKEEAGKRPLQSIKLVSFTHVVVLDVSHNALVSLEGVEQMKSLRVLHASHNKLVDLSPLFRPHSLLMRHGALQVLDVGFNKIRAMHTFDAPECGWNTAEKCGDDRDMTKDPGEECTSSQRVQLKGLRILILTFNLLTDFAAVVSVFPDLQELRAASNQIATVSPLSIVPKFLRYISLQRNCLSKSSIRALMELQGRMRQLQVLNVGGQRAPHGNAELKKSLSPRGCSGSTAKNKKLSGCGMNNLKRSKQTSSKSNDKSGRNDTIGDELSCNEALSMDSELSENIGVGAVLGDDSQNCEEAHVSGAEEKETSAVEAASIVHSFSSIEMCEDDVEDAVANGNAAPNAVVADPGQHSRGSSIKNAVEVVESAEDSLSTSDNPSEDGHICDSISSVAESGDEGNDEGEGATDTTAICFGSESKTIQSTRHVDPISVVQPVTSTEGKFEQLNTGTAHVEEGNCYLTEQGEQPCGLMESTDKVTADLPFPCAFQRFSPRVRGAFGWGWLAAELKPPLRLAERR
ncbi:putative leucine-rich repeat protein (LRRP) [Trypanosoma vivax]|nr:putative leucine-rich repeat protein (LRRP) [Trypanosoma vivax]